MGYVVLEVQLGLPEIVTISFPRRVNKTNNLIIRIRFMDPGVTRGV